MRIQPYRTVENVIEGAVITFSDVTALKKAEESLRRLAVVVRDSNDAVTVQDLEGRILTWNPAAARMYGWSEAEALSMNVQELVPDGTRNDARQVVDRLIRAEALKPYRVQRIMKNGATVDVMMTASALINEAGEAYAIVTTERVIPRGDDTSGEDIP